MTGSAETLVSSGPFLSSSARTNSHLADAKESRGELERGRPSGVCGAQAMADYGKR